jgi:pyruvate/2-oxoacid:ferredoxin oxidoreductase alpha subunit
VFEEIGDAQRASRTYGQLGMIAEEQGNLTQALEWVARTYRAAEEYQLPVLVQVKAHMARLRDKYGPENFARWWVDFTGEQPPADLEVDTSTIL